MAENKIALESNGIKRALSKYNISIYDSIAEYIWNGFDAGAKTVEIVFVNNPIGGLDRIDIIDDGEGISKESLNQKFKPIFDSNKIKSRTIDVKNSSIIHGRNGVGRFTFFVFAGNAVWKTIYNQGSKNYKYSINIKSDSLDSYIVSEKDETSEKTGTIVSFYNLKLDDFSFDNLNSYLQAEFSWYLELNQSNNKLVLLNGAPLDYSSIIQYKETKKYTEEKSGIRFDVTYINWAIKLHDEYSKYYYVNHNGIEIFKENTTLNNKGDKFYHSVFIKSPLFDEFKFDTNNEEVLFGYSRSSTEFIFIKTEVDNHLRQLRSPFIDQYTKKYIEELKNDGAYPDFHNDSFLDKVRENALDRIITAVYCAEPTIFSSLNKIQKKTLVRLFDLSLQSGETENLYNILSGILDMTTDERAELANLLNYTNMSHITKTIKVIKDRLEVIQELKKLVFNNEQYSTEVNHIQPFIEKNYWLFGEQYYLVTAEEPDFEEALRRFLYIFRGENNKKRNINIENKHKNKEMDIFAVQRKLDGNIKKCIVVELKRPSITLSSKEFQQVKDYFSVISDESRFNAPNIEWVFFLVGNDYNKEIVREFENAKAHGEKSLAYYADNKKIYIKTWSEIFTEHEINLNFLKEKLEINQIELDKEIATLSPEDIVNSNNTSNRPPEMELP